jgi:purine-nucleoside phosphorylase
LILGSGLGPVVRAVAIESSIPYADIPGFPVSTAIGHAGRLSIGRLDGVPLVLLEGRKHLYEGCAAAQATLPVRVLQALGVTTLVVTNAAGGLHPDLTVGDIVVLDDVQNLMFANPLIGPHDDRWGPRFPDLCRPFDPALIDFALEAARQAGVPARKGVYAAVAGPNYETRAEQRMYRRLGADVIGMSTAPETIVAAQLGLRVLGLSTVTNCCRPDAPEPTDGGAVVHAASQAAERVLAILRGVIPRLAPR